MNYIDTNKAAWEEAFDNRHTDWAANNYLRVKSEKFAFFDSDLKDLLKNMDFKGKTVAQFCCNDGRELLSLMDSGADFGVGFDIAENMIEHAKETAEKASIKNCEFHACDILEIPECWHDKFDLILLTIGAITWFEDITLFFEMVAKCLKSNGLVIINDYHPMVNMLPLPGEAEYNHDDLNRVVFSYFKKEPWVDNNGMGYMSTLQESKTFTSYTHTMADIINALVANGLNITKFQEYDYDIMFETKVYEGKGFPLSYILIAEKED